MKPRALKEVAQAGLVLGFEWIARDKYAGYHFHVIDPIYQVTDWTSPGKSALCNGIKITDYPDLPPEKSLLRLRDIMEGTV